jgi:hypothetical protein
VSAKYDSKNRVVASRIYIASKHIGGNDTLKLVSFLASVDRIDSYESSSVTTVVLSGHVTDVPNESLSFLSLGDPVVLSFETNRSNPRRLLYVVEMLPGMSFAPRLTSARVTLPIHAERSTAK